jgi:ribosome biogenesis GTPase
VSDTTLPGWDAGWTATFAPFAAEGRRAGRVVAVHRDTSIVRDEDGDRPRQVSGTFRRAALAVADFPTVGDWVALDADGVIVAVLPRRTVFKRMAADGTRRGGGLDDEQVMAANVDLALLVAGLDHDFNLRRIERYLAVARSSAIPALIVLTKSDVADDVDDRRRELTGIAPDSPVVAVSSRTGDGLDELRAHLRPGLTAAILGSSGVGKSTLVNALLGEERQRTAAVRESDSRGRHTTTHRELFELDGGALLVDTPGIRALEVLGADEGVEESFDEIADIVADCRFANCGHEGEPGCAVRAALADGRITEVRFASWRKLHAETAQIAREGDPRARAEARRTHRTAQRATRARERREEREDQ